MKEYQLSDYEFKDEAGNIYISTPEFDMMPTIILMLVISMLIIPVMAIIFNLSLI
jgi:hypothetical protein